MKCIVKTLAWVTMIAVCHHRVIISAASTLEGDFPRIARRNALRIENELHAQGFKDCAISVLEAER